MPVTKLKRHDLKQEITKGYGVRATTIRGPNAFDVTLRFKHNIDHGHKCALLKFHLTDDQNMRDQSTIRVRILYLACTFISFPFAKNSYGESKPGSKNQKARFRCRKANPGRMSTSGLR